MRTAFHGFRTGNIPREGRLLDKLQNEFDKLFGGQKQNIRALNAKELGKRISEKGDAIDGAAK